MRGITANSRLPPRPLPLPLARAPCFCAALAASASARDPADVVAATAAARSFLACAALDSRSLSALPPTKYWYDAGAAAATSATKASETPHFFMFDMSSPEADHWNQ